MVKGSKRVKPKAVGHEKAAIFAFLFEFDCSRWGADNENDEEAAFCCAEARASGRGAARAGEGSRECSTGAGDGNRAPLCRAG